MERLARLLPFRQFGRLRHLRTLVPCISAAAAASAVEAVSAPRTAPLFGNEAELLPALPSAQPAFARVSLNAGVHSEPARRAPVRVYHGPSRLIMVGTFEAVCRMIDHCIAEQGAGA
ncbi:hypothetical protein [Paraburkholderia kururiensis]|uniref:hypothetical protein n=1 Tax=Paraburkholderia kururiensis TaxID=984307 RepID=UPI0005AB453B|nr:hypothetical protein [Paraburkholderia kururiensis]